MENKNENEQPAFTRTMIKGIPYYRTRITDADGKRVSLYARTEKELAVKLAMAKGIIEDARFRKYNPTVAEYAEKWLVMQSAHIQPSTLEGYANSVRKYIIGPLGDMYMSDVTADDIKLAMVPVAKKSAAVYSMVNMLFKSIFYSAEYSNLIKDNPTKKLNAKGGTPKKEKEALTDEQAAKLLDTIKGLPPYVFVMIGLYSGLRREEILALQWDCVFLDCPTPYISVRRAWHEEKNRPIINTDLKTKSARRDVPIPKVLVDCLKEEKEKTISDYVIADSEGQPLSYSQFVRIWNYIKVRSTKERTLYKYVNGQAIKKTFKPEPGQKCVNRENIVYCIDFDVTPHLLRHTYITNLIHAGVDPKTVQYLAGHKNSKVTMDIYAKVKYNKPEELSAVVNEALDNRSEKAENAVSEDS
ncbi:MAG: site-specific integrase [Clostridia bacterium]|nr:site-specific integrase [Clostridia bacterium]